MSKLRVAAPFSGYRRIANPADETDVFFYSAQERSVMTAGILVPMSEADFNEFLRYRGQYRFHLMHAVFSRALKMRSQEYEQKLHEIQQQLDRARAAKRAASIRAIRERRRLQQTASADPD